MFTLGVIPDRPPAWGLGKGLTTTHHKKPLVSKYYSRPRN